MASKPQPLMLDGVARKVDRDDEALRDLRIENQRLQDELRTAKRALEDQEEANGKLKRAIRSVQNVFGGMHTSLRAVFGEIELAVGEEVGVPMTGHPGQQAGPSISAADPKWESYKRSFPNAPAKIIDALLAHREGMTIRQLSKLLHMDYGTAKLAVSKLREAGALTRGGKGEPVRLNG
jgi:hypothetical protein